MVIELPSAQDVVVRSLLERNAGKRPDDTLVRFQDGSSWTRQEALEAAYTAGNELRRAGVDRGDAVAIFLPNGPDFLRAWWGVCSIGAVIVPVNLAYRGTILEHLLRTGGCRAVVVDDRYAGRINELDDPECRDVRRIDPATLRLGDHRAPELERAIQPWDVHLLSMTSGTTGLSKVSRTTYWHTCLGQSYLTRWGFGRDDVYLIDLPLFHAGGMYSVMVTLAMDAGFVVRDLPALSTYWETARELGVTTAVLVSSMITYLMAQPERPTDRDHPLRRILSIPMPGDPAAFMRRFGVTAMATGYGSTEVPACIVGRPDDTAVPGSCGQVREGFQVRLVDEHDIEVPVGSVGEAVVRTEQPWMISQGYQNNPGATVEAWRNGWFHSGDLLRRDAEGNYFFVDRGKDSLRRRGENVSTFEVETEVGRFPGVAEVACVAALVADQLDDEVKVWLVPKPGVQLDPAGLLRFCASRMPHFMVPRFVEIVDELPKTPTTKVRKFLLRERGNSDRTWDREAHGFRLTREGLVGQRPV
jgi:crotonobetaine/carnitine-CoA ligase